MTATNTSKPAKDGTAAPFNLSMAAESVSTNTAQETYLKSPSTEALIEPATAANQCVTAAGTPASNLEGIQGAPGGVPVQISGTITASFSGFTPTPAYAALAANTTSANVALPVGATVVIYNAGPVAAFVKFGTTNAVVATTADDQIAPGWSCFAVGSNFYLAAITMSGAAALTLSGGAGTLTGAISGGPVTAAAGAFVDGSIATIGTEADAAWVSGSGTLISIVKAIAGKLAGTLTTVISGAVAVTGTFWPATQPISAAALPLPSGAMQQSGGSITVIGRTTMATSTPTVTSNGVYAAGNEIGGLMTFAIGGAASGELKSVRVTSKTGALTTALQAYVFTTNPTNSTWADKTAPAINAADNAGLLCCIDMSNPASGLGTHTVWSVGNIGAQFVAANLYVVLVVNSAATLTSTSTTDITVELGIRDD